MEITVEERVKQLEIECLKLRSKIKILETEKEVAKEIRKIEIDHLRRCMLMESEMILR